MTEILIRDYNVSDSAELLRLLLELHGNYYEASAAPELQELSQEKDIQKSYKDYIQFINESGDEWKVLVAVSGSGRVAGFIIGSLEDDPQLVRSTTGKLEDWYVEEDFRKLGIGRKLYVALEQWFIQKGCARVISDTWANNETSIKAHQELGFFVSGVMFSKKVG